MDIAFTKWGHVYHTRYDHHDMLMTGVIQNAGNMVLAVVSAAADSAELETQVNMLTDAVVKCNNVADNFLVI